MEYDGGVLKLEHNGGVFKWSMVEGCSNKA